MTDMPRPAPGIHLLPVEPGAVLFAESSQNLYALNGAAALAWSGLEAGLDDKAILDALIAAGAPTAEARRWYRQSIEMFALRGLLEGSTAPASPRIQTRAFGEDGAPAGHEGPVRERMFLRVFDSLVELRLSDAALRSMIDDIFGPFLAAPQAPAGDKPADIVLGIAETKDGWVVTREGILAARTATLGEAAVEIGQGVTRLALQQARYLLEIRAALLTRGAKGFLFAGPSGSGKSTLAAALMHRGWRYGSDERALLTVPNFTLRAAPKSLRLNRGSWPILAPMFAGLATSAVYGKAGRPQRYLQPQGEVVREAAIGHVMFCHYRSGGATAQRILPRHEGLQDLFANCASVSRRLALADVEALVAWSEGVAFHRLDVGDLGKALELLEQLA